MDPVSQAVVGAATAAIASNKTTLPKAMAIGALAGMAPDLDVLIRSHHDPLLAIEYHRHFTHSIAFAPIGALLLSLVFYVLLAKRWQLSFKTVFTFSFLGMLSHGILDAFTSYGTHLLLPFSNARTAWDSIAVVDPLFTLPVLLAIVFAAYRQSRKALLTGVAWGVAYLSLGFVQHYRALDMLEQIVQQRGHSASQISVKPSFANLAVWKTIYLHEGRFYVDAVHTFATKPYYWQGGDIAKLDISLHFASLPSNSQQYADIERFRFFSSDHLGVDTNKPNRIIDIRYSLLPNDLKPLWGIDIHPDSRLDAHVTYTTSRDNPVEAIAELWQMISQPSATAQLLN